MVSQLRDYRIEEGSLGRFVSEWSDQIAPLRRAMGFTIDGAWTIPEESRFVWLLSHAGSWQDFATADRAYYASPERARLDPDPARLIVAQSVAQLDEVVRSG
jgi:hypothetical protein